MGLSGGPLGLRPTWLLGGHPGLRSLWAPWAFPSRHQFTKQEALARGLRGAHSWGPLVGKGDDLDSPCFAAGVAEGTLLTPGTHPPPRPLPTPVVAKEATP